MLAKLPTLGRLSRGSYIKGCCRPWTAATMMMSHGLLTNHKTLGHINLYTAYRAGATIGNERKISIPETPTAYEPLKRPNVLPPRQMKFLHNQVVPPLLHNRYRFTILCTYSLSHPDILH